METAIYEGSAHRFRDLENLEGKWVEIFWGRSWPCLSRFQGNKLSIQTNCYAIYSSQHHRSSEQSALHGIQVYPWNPSHQQHEHKLSHRYKWYSIYFIYFRYLDISNISEKTYLVDIMEVVFNTKASRTLQGQR